MNAKKIKILHLIASRGVYGAERVVLTLCKHADLEKIDPVVGIFRKKGTGGDQLLKEVLSLGITVNEIRYKTAFDITQLFNLYKVVKQHRPQLIHTHEYKTNILGFCIARILGIPIVTTVHALHKLQGKARVEVRFSLWLLKYFMAVMPVSEDVRDQLEALGIPTKKIMTIKNVPPLTEKTLIAEAESFREEMGIPLQWKLIGFVGRLIEAKGCDQLIHAIAQISKERRDFFLVIAGEGPERGSLEALAKKLGVHEMVSFCGFRSDTEYIYGSLDLLVLPSREEGTPLVMLEGMVQEVPIVATTVGGIPEVIKDRVNGLLVPPDDPSALAEAIVSSLSMPDETRKRVLEAKKTVTESYNVEAWIKKYQDVYDRVSQQISR